MMNRATMTAKLNLANAAWSPGRFEPKIPAGLSVTRYAVEPQSGRVDAGDFSVTFGTRGWYCEKCLCRQILDPGVDAIAAALAHAEEHLS